MSSFFSFFIIFFFFNDTATTEIYTLSLHDALPIRTTRDRGTCCSWRTTSSAACCDRKSTRLNSSHVKISYAVFCLKKKKSAVSLGVADAPASETRCAVPGRNSPLCHADTGNPRRRADPDCRGDSVDFFFFNDTATTEIYTLSLHDALPISALGDHLRTGGTAGMTLRALNYSGGDRKSTRLNSSHVKISYAVFCLKKKK